MSSIARLRGLVVRKVVLKATYFLYGRLYGMTLGEGVRISLGARLDKTNPRGVHIGDYTAVTSGAVIISHDFVNREWKDVHIGKNCFLGFNCIILPGITIGDNCIIAASSVVGRDVPAGSVVFGNPGKVVERDIKTDKWGIRLDKGNSAPV